MGLLGLVKAESHIAGKEGIVEPNLQDVFEAAMHNTVQYLIDKKTEHGELTKDQKIKINALEAKLDECAPAAFLWPEDVAKQDKADANEWKKTHDGDLKANKEKGRKEDFVDILDARKPAPLVLPSEGVWGRIAKGSGKAERKEWSGIKDEKARAENRDLAERMRVLHREEVEPMSEPFNTKLPGHKELADILFSDSTLRRLEWAALPPPPAGTKDKIPAHPPEFTARARAVLAAFNAVKMEDVPADQHWRYEEIKQRIHESPGLMIAAFASDADLKATRECQRELLGHDADTTEKWRRIERKRRSGQPRAGAGVA
jgi:hypothetical protein